MYRILSASKDTYITNKIVNNRFRATDANVGQAGTLDLLKLYNESTLTGEDTPVELSRLLIKFDLDKIKTMHNAGDINVGDSSFKSTLKLHDVYGGQTTPSNFKCIVFPLAKEFDEGTGYDVANFSDLDGTNYITASYSNGTATEWVLPGAMKSGSLADSATIDVITSGTIAGESGLQSLCFEQHFIEGTEDLEIDVTKFVSASVKDLISNKGFLISYSGSYEKDNYSYFVKRFASRNSANTSIRPKLIVEFDDSIEDNHCNFVFNKSGSLYLSNQVRGNLENLRTGDAPGDLATGAECMILKIVTGSIFKETFKVSQALRGENRITGLYSASFAISSFGSLYEHVRASGSITFDEVWSSSDESVFYHSGSLTIGRNQINQYSLHQTSYHITTLNLADRYKSNELARIRVFIEEKDRSVTYHKKPYEKKSQVYNNVHYRVRDFISGDIIIPFNKTQNCNKLSSDSNGMYFDFYMDTLPRGRTYVFEFLIVIDDYDTVVSDSASKFIIE